MRFETRGRIVDLLLQQVHDETDQATESLRVLGELSVDGDVLSRMSALATDTELSAWTRALVADRIADIDPAKGRELLRDAAAHADEVVRAWIADTLHERGGRVDPALRLPLSADAVPTRGRRPLSALDRQALTRRLSDLRATEAERVAAARQLAQGGDLTPLRAMADAADVDPLHRVDLAAALFDAGDPGLLRSLGAGVAGTPQAAYAAALALFERGDPTAGPALRAVAETYPDRPMAYGAAARCVELGDRGPLTQLASQHGEVHVRLAAARRLAALVNVHGLSWLLEGPQVPAIEAAILSGLLEAGRVEAVPRLQRLLRRHRFRTYKQMELRYLLAANGDRRSWDILRRRARWRPGSGASIEAAVALTALADPRGPDRLRRTSASRRRSQRSRMWAAVGLAQLDQASGREVLQHLAAPASSPALRLRAATVAIGMVDFADPLVDLALDETAPAKQRAAAIDVLIKDNNRALPTLKTLATSATTPALVRAAVAPLLPDREATTVLSSIAADAADTTARVTAIAELDSIDSRAARALFGRLLRDRRVWRFRCWWLAVTRDDLLSDADANTLADRLGNPDDGMLRWGRSLAVLVVRRPENVLRTLAD